MVGGRKAAPLPALARAAPLHYSTCSISLSLSRDASTSRLSCVRLCGEHACSLRPSEGIDEELPVCEFVHPDAFEIG